MTLHDSQAFIAWRVVCFDFVIGWEHLGNSLRFLFVLRRCPKAVNRQRQTYMYFTGSGCIIPCYDNETSAMLEQFEINSPTSIRHRMFLMS